MTWALTLLMLACGGEVVETPEPPPEPAPKAQPDPVDQVRAARKAEPATLELWTLPEGAHPAMTDPTQATETAPDSYKVKLVTTKGEAIIQVHREWAPNGADRFYNLVKIGFFSDIAFFRAIDKFMVQGGISGYPEVAKVWRDAHIQDDPKRESNTKGRVTFATAGPNTRTTQFFINYKDNSFLDNQGFSPIGEVIEGMDIIDSLHKGYGEGAPSGRGPNQMRIQAQGNAYLQDKFDKLDYIKSATLVE